MARPYVFTTQNSDKCRKFWVHLFVDTVLLVLAAAGGSSAALQPRGHGANHIMVLAAAKATPILGHSS